MADPTTHTGSDGPAFSDGARVDVLHAMDRTHADPVSHQEKLESQNAELQVMRTFLTSILASLRRLLAAVAQGLNNPIRFVDAKAHAPERYAGKFETCFARVQDGASRDEPVALRQSLRLNRKDATLREAINGACDGAEPVRDIVEDLRRLSSDGSGELVVFHLTETARIAASWVPRGGKQPVTPDTSGLTATQVLGRPGHVQQVVMNLLQNSVDALEGVAAAAIRLSNAVQDGPASLRVADNGPGMPPEVRAAILDPLSTTKAVGCGTGLGLSISRKIAEKRGGSLTLAETASGACFVLDLPLAAAERDSR